MQEDGVTEVVAAVHLSEIPASGLVSAARDLCDGTADTEEGMLVLGLIKQVADRKSVV